MDPAPQQPQPPAPPIGGSGRTRLLLVGVAGLVLGVLIGLLAGRLLPSDRITLGTADADAQLACDYVASVGGGGVDTDTLQLDNPVIFRVQAAGSMAMAAGYGDPRYQTLGDQGLDLIDGVVRIDADLIASTLGAMSRTCDDL